MAALHRLGFLRGLHLVSGPWQCNSSSVPALPPSLLLSPSLIRQAAVCAAELRCKFLFSDRRMPMGPLNSLIPRRIKIHHFFFFFCIPFIILTLLSCSFPVVTQIWDHIASPSPTSPLRCVPLIFIARIIQHFLPSSTRVELYLPTLLSALNS